MKILFRIITYSIFILLCLSVCAACSSREAASESETSESDASDSVTSESIPPDPITSEPVTSESSASSHSESSSTPELPPESTIDETSDPVITFDLPDTWEQKDNAFYEDDALVAEILPSFKGSASELEAEYKDNVKTENFVFNGIEGTYFHMQSEIEKDGISAFSNELIYCFLHDSGEYSIVAFYPYFGTGIGTQREEFEKNFLNVVWLA